MSYQLFIDDERMPVDRNNQPWMIARNIQEVKQIVSRLGPPCYVSFDHDLGEQEPTGLDIAKWFVEQDLDGKLDLGGPFGDQFDFYVHSQNPIGKRNIETYLGQYMNMKREG